LLLDAMSETTNGLHATASGLNEVKIKKKVTCFSFAEFTVCFAHCSAVQNKKKIILWTLKFEIILIRHCKIQEF
jgi:hypothetical protein